LTSLARFAAFFILCGAAAAALVQLPLGSLFARLGLFLGDLLERLGSGNLTQDDADARPKHRRPFLRTMTVGGVWSAGRAQRGRRCGEQLFQSMSSLG